MTSWHESLHKLSSIVYDDDGTGNDTYDPVDGPYGEDAYTIKEPVDGPYGEDAYANK